VLPVAAAAAAVVWLIGPDGRGDGQRAPAAAVDRLVWPNPSIPQPLEQRIAPESTPELKIAALSSAQANTPPTRPAAAAQDRPAASGISSNQAGPAEPVRPPPAERATESLASGRGGTTGNALLSAPAAEKSEPRSSPEAAVLKRPTMPQITAASAFAAMFDTTALRAVVIRSADPAVRWRITGAGVQRSTDGGSTWQSQDAGSAAVQLVAGVSPSPTVCWMVGRGGTVLLSIDGSSWRQLAFPEAVDLTSVAATSAGAATVTTSDGRVFGTTDGGATWTAK
jgi:hypothetical protein